MSPGLKRSQAPMAGSREVRRSGSLLVNLSAQPFVNRRPVKRFMVTAWVAGALLAGLNVFLWLQYRHDSTALRTRLAETRSAIDATSGRVVEIGRELAALDLGAQNAQVDFLNRRISERTFPWSLLFERIATVLPEGVRLISLTPVFQAREVRPGRTPPPPPPPDGELVGLRIRGAAKSDVDLYDLIDAFFASPLFERPRLHQESASSGEVQFSVDVEYRPRPAPGTAVAPEGPPEPEQPPAVQPPLEVAEAAGRVSG